MAKLINGTLSRNQFRFHFQQLAINYGCEMTDAEIKQVQWFRLDLYVAVGEELLEKAALRNGSRIGESEVAVRPRDNWYLGKLEEDIIKTLLESLRE